jgi:hypothetical protein
MSDGTLNALERDVELARTKFADDLARIRSPTTLARFKDDLWVEARETKDEWVGKGKEAAKDAAYRLVTDLKERAAANPAAALAIGAGVAWRLFHRPPIATALVGIGLFTLLRATPSQRSAEPYVGLHDEDPRPEYRADTGLAAQTAELGEVAQHKVQEWSAQAGDTARQTATQLADAAASAGERAAAGLHDARDAVRDTVTDIADKASSVATRASEKLQDAIPSRDDRDAYLLGAAALAVAAAVGIAYQRRAHDPSSGRDT